MAVVDRPLKMNVRWGARWASIGKGIVKSKQKEKEDNV